MTLPAFTMSNFAVSRKRLAFLCAAVLALLIAACFAWAGNRGFFAVAGQNNQHFTELYFTSSKVIPQRVESGRAYTASFAIVNREGERRHYNYQTTITHGSEDQRQPRQTVSLNDGERAVRDIQFLIPHVTQPVTVTVQLQQPEQTITFRVEP